MTLDLATARTIIAKTLESGRSSGFQPLTVVVLDAGGHVVAVEREDGSSNKRFEIAFAKANGAIGFGLGSRALMARAEAFPPFVTGAMSAIGGALIPVPGGVLVRDADGAIIGAVGISGDNSDNDEAAGIVGIEAAGLVADPG